MPAKNNSNKDNLNTEEVWAISGRRTDLNERVHRFFKQSWLPIALTRISGL